MSGRRPEIVLVIARAENGVIGRGGQLPWHIPADLRHFRRITGSDFMIMGRRTFQSLPKLLPGRAHIVLTRDPGFAAPGATVVASMDEALAAAAPAERICVIGGAEVYRLFLPLADRIELTRVHDAPEGDTAIEQPNPAEWREVAREEVTATAGQPALSFVTLVRRGA